MRTRKIKRARLSKTKRKGGKLIAQGANGCTYGPAIRCVNEPNRRKGVSKLLRMKSAMDEADMVSRVRQIDPTMKFSVFWNDSCDPDLKGRTPEEVEEDERGHTCRLHAPDTLLLGPYGGMALKDVQDPKTLAVSLMNAFIGLAEYHKNDFVHSDIKDDNLLFFERRARFIDFGNSNNLQNMYVDDDRVKRYMSEIGIIAWPSSHTPPEMSLLFGNFDQGERLSRKELQQAFEVAIYENNERDTGRYNYDILYEMYPKTEQEAKDLAKMVDIYQMGNLLYTLIDEDLLSFELMDEIEEFASSLANIDPRKRPTAEEAKVQYAKLMGISLQKYIPTPLVETENDSESGSTPVPKISSTNITQKLKRQQANRNLLTPTLTYAPLTKAVAPAPAPAPAPSGKFVPPVYKNPFEKTDKRLFTLRTLFPNPVGSGKKTRKLRVRFG